MEQSKRLVALDVFRGITIAGMILVNTPGTWEYVYPPLRHAPWHGCTPTDWVFPFFLFIVGVAIPLALGRRMEEGADRQRLMLKIFKRTLIIFGVGLFLNSFSLSNGYLQFKLATLRIPGVLQRIALVYFFCSLIFVYAKSWRRQLWIGAGLLLLYWVLMALVPVPWPDGVLAGNFDMLTNLGTWLDRMILGESHMYHGEQVNGQAVAFDPEGILSTIPAVVTGLSGVLTGLWIKSSRSDFEKLTGLFAIGTILLALGLVWDVSFPINKKIWTSSYVLYMSGVALLFLGLVYWLVDVRQNKWWTKPFVVYGTNALFAYFMSSFVVKLMLFPLAADATGNKRNIYGSIYYTVFEPLFASAYNASLAFAITFVLFILGLTWILYWKKIFIKA